MRGKNGSGLEVYLVCGNHDLEEVDTLHSRSRKESPSSTCKAIYDPSISPSSDFKIVIDRIAPQEEITDIILETTIDGQALPIQVVRSNAKLPIKISHYYTKVAGASYISDMKLKRMKTGAEEGGGDMGMGRIVVKVWNGKAKNQFLTLNNGTTHLAEKEIEGMDCVVQRGTMSQAKKTLHSEFVKFNQVNATYTFVFEYGSITPPADLDIPLSPSIDTAMGKATLLKQINHANSPQSPEISEDDRPSSPDDPSLEGQEGDEPSSPDEPVWSSSLEKLMQNKYDAPLTSSPTKDISPPPNAQPQPGAHISIPNPLPFEDDSDLEDDINVSSEPLTEIATPPVTSSPLTKATIQRGSPIQQQFDIQNLPLPPRRDLAKPTSDVPEVPSRSSRITRNGQGKSTRPEEDKQERDHKRARPVFNFRSPRKMR